MMSCHTHTVIHKMEMAFKSVMGKGGGGNINRHVIPG